MALDQCSSWRFEACSCKPTSRDLPSSSVKHRTRSKPERLRSQHTTSSYLIERHRRSMKMLSMKRPRPSIEIATPAASSLPVNAALVNCAPWTPFCLSSGNSRGVDFLATLCDGREDLSRKVAFQGSNGVEFGMPFCYSTGNV